MMMRLFDEMVVLLFCLRMVVFVLDGVLLFGIVMDGVFLLLSLMVGIFGVGLMGVFVVIFGSFFIVLV